MESIPKCYKSYKKLKEGNKLEKWTEDKKKKHEADENNYVLERFYKESKEYFRLVQWKLKLEKQK